MLPHCFAITVLTLVFLKSSDGWLLGKWCKDESSGWCKILLVFFACHILSWAGYCAGIYEVAGWNAHPYVKWSHFRENWGSDVFTTICYVKLVLCCGFIWIGYSFASVCSPVQRCGHCLFMIRWFILCKLSIRFAHRYNYVFNSLVSCDAQSLNRSWDLYVDQFRRTELKST